MALLNTEFFYLDRFDLITRRPDCGLWHLIGLSEPGDFYYLEFFNSLSQLRNVIPADVMSQIQNNTVTLVLCNSNEAFHSVVTDVYQAIGDLLIPESGVILVSESADIRDEIKMVATVTGKKEIRAIWLRALENWCHQYMRVTLNAGTRNVDTLPKLEVNLGPYEKKFLNFNRRWRAQRPTMVALLLTRNLLDKGYVSLAPCDNAGSWEENWLAMMSHHSDNIGDLLTEYESQIKSIPALYLDTEDIGNDVARMSHATDYLYRNTYFSLVSETNFYDYSPGRFVTEKTFKPIVMGHPFIQVNRPKTLELLKAIGYRTFHPWIDERYDTILDSSDRLLAVLSEVERLSNLNQQELIEFITGVRETCEFNRELLLSKTKFVTF